MKYKHVARKSLQNSQTPHKLFGFSLLNLLICVVVTACENNNSDEGFLSVTPTELAFGAHDNVSKALTVQTNAKNWSATPSENWITASQGMDKLTVSVKNHTETTGRTGSITVTAGSATPVTVTVTQALAPTTLSVTPSTLFFFGLYVTPAQTVTVATNFVSWNYSCDAQWLTFEKLDDQLSVAVSEFNSGTVERKATITVTADDKTEVIEVTQDFLQTVDVGVGASTGVSVMSIGVELDPHFFSQNVTRNADPADWDKIIVKRVTDMKISSFRVMVFPEWYEPVNDNNDPSVTSWDKLTFNSQEMQSLYKVLDLAQKNDISVTLVLWGAHKLNMCLLEPEYAHIKDHFLAENNSYNNWMVAPKNIEEWCENFSVLVQYLLESKKYTCVREITPMNEPSYSYNIDGTVSSAKYVEMCKKLDARFKADNIRNKVRFNLSDDAENVQFLKTCTTGLSDVADIFNSHTYLFGYETNNSVIIKWEQNNLNLTNASGKKHFVGEFGSNQTVGASRQKDIDLYERGVLMARIVLNFLNAGASGVSYWSLLDQYYSRFDSYAQMQQLGLWRSKKVDYASEPYFNDIKRDYQPRPQYYAYSLLTRFIRPGADVHPIDLNDKTSAATAFKSENGKWTYVFANGSALKSYAITNGYGGADGEYDVYRYKNGELPDDDSMIQPSESVRTKDQKLEILIPSQSVVVCKQK